LKTAGFVFRSFIGFRKTGNEIAAHFSVAFGAFVFIKASGKLLSVPLKS
jgi:hypothetical protein